MNDTLDAVESVNVRRPSKAISGLPVFSTQPSDYIKRRNERLFCFIRACCKRIASMVAGAMAGGAFRRAAAVEVEVGLEKVEVGLEKVAVREEDGTPAGREEAGIESNGWKAHD